MYGVVFNNNDLGVMFYLGITNTNRYYSIKRCHIESIVQSILIK